MTEEQKTSKKYKDTTFDMASCMAMKEKIMGGHWEECICEEMMSQVTDMEGIPGEWLKVMSQMMEVHCGTQEETEETTQEA